MRTNVNGTFALLEEARAYVAEIGMDEESASRFLHVSSEEVYGSLRTDDPPFWKLRSALPIARVPHPKRHPTIWFALSITTRSILCEG